jgi:hypothetical protein
MLEINYEGRTVYMVYPVLMVYYGSLGQFLFKVGPDYITAYCPKAISKYLYYPVNNDPSNNVY